MYRDSNVIINTNKICNITYYPRNKKIQKLHFSAFTLFLVYFQESNRRKPLYYLFLRVVLTSLLHFPFLILTYLN